MNAQNVSRPHRGGAVRNDCFPVGKDFFELVIHKDRLGRQDQITPVTDFRCRRRGLNFHTTFSDPILSGSLSVPLIWKCIDRFSNSLGCKPTSHIFGDSYLSLTYPSIYLPHCPMPSFLQCLVFSTFFSCRSNAFNVESKTALWKLSFSSSAIISLFPSGVDNPFLWDHQA